MAHSQAYTMLMFDFYALILIRRGGGGGSDDDYEDEDAELVIEDENVGNTRFKCER